MSKKKNFITMIKALCILIAIAVTFNCNPVQASSTQASKPAMPYTKQASDKLAKILIANQNSLPIIKQNATSSEALELYIKYYIKGWGMAGYDFRKSMNRYIYKMKTEPMAMSCPPLYEYSMAEMLAYLKISELCQRKQDEIVLKKYFSQEVINSFNADISRKLVASEKPQYWFPPGVVSYMLTDKQMRSYEVVSENSLKSNLNMNSPFLQQKIKEAKMQGRPLIAKDLADGNKDYQMLKEINLALNDGIGTMGETYGSLTQNQEAQLNKIINEYGTSILDEDVKRKLERYRQRQAYIGANNINKTAEEPQFSTMEGRKPADRVDVHRFYDGFEYSPVIPSPNMIKTNLLQNGISTFTNYMQCLPGF